MINKLRDLVNEQADVEFSYNGKEYTLLAWIDEGISVGEKDNDLDDNIYSDFDDLLNNYRIQGSCFRDILDDIVITFSS